MATCGFAGERYVLLPGNAACKDADQLANPFNDASTLAGRLKAAVEDGVINRAVARAERRGRGW